MKELPKGWKSVRFEDVFERLPKTKIKAGEGLEVGKYKFFTSSGEQKKFLNSHTFDGEHLIFGTGGIASIHYCNEKFATSNDCFVMKLKTKDIILKYIYYFFRSHMYLLEEGFHGVGLKHLSRQHLNKISIPCPGSKETQKKIVFILEKAEALKSSREEADRLTDELLKSVFYEMFGKYFEDKKYLKKIEFFCPDRKNAIKAGPFGSSLKKESYVKKGYKIYGQEQVIKDDLKFGDYYISREKYMELENYKVREGDILISLVGTYGKISIVPKDFEEGIINPRLMKITLDKTKMNPLFFKHLFLSYFVKAQLEQVSHGGTMDILNVGLIKNTNFPETPISLQDKFVSIVKEVELIKKQQKYSKKIVGTMLNILMQKAFSGELVD